MKFSHLIFSPNSLPSNAFPEIFPSSVRAPGRHFRGHGAVCRGPGEHHRLRARAAAGARHPGGGDPHPGAGVHHVHLHPVGQVRG